MTNIQIGWTMVVGQTVIGVLLLMLLNQGDKRPTVMLEYPSHAVIGPQSLPVAPKSFSLADMK